MAKKPTDRVKKLKLARDGYEYTATWDYTKKSKSGDYAYSKVFCLWNIIPQSGEALLDRNKQKGVNDKTDSENVNSFTATKPKGKHYTRASWYPGSSKTVMGVSVNVWGENGAGKGPVAGALLAFKEPKDPKVSWTFNEQSQSVTLTITSDEGKGQYERYDTVARVEVKLGDGTTQQIRANSSIGQGQTWSATYQLASYEADFSVGETLEFRCTAYSRGFKGDSESVSSKILVGAPNAATITSVTAESKDATGRIRVGVKVGARTSSVQLQRRHGESGSWENVDGATDDGKCKALYDVVGLANPNDGENLYYRVVSTNYNYITTSEPFWAEDLFTALPTAGSVDVGIVDIQAADNGVSAVAVIGWSTEDQEADGIEVSWSEDPNAWESTEPPNTFDATWKDDISQSQDWDNTLKIYILGLEQGVTYYVKARAYVETDDGRSYTDYTAFETVSPVTRPSSVVLAAPQYVARGEAIPLTWTFDGDSEQTEWHIFSDENDSSPLAEGWDAMGYASIPAEMYGDSQAVSLYAQVGAGGATTTSNTVVVGITDYPECSVEEVGTVTAKPFYVTAHSTSPNSRAVVRCVSQGIGNHGPLGNDAQYAGDTAWAANVNPEWLPVNDHYEAQIEVPTTAQLVDSASYDLILFVVDNVTGLQSEVAETSFDVAWEHQAIDPPSGIRVRESEARRSATIRLVAPEGAAETDVYDLYRGSASGYELIATDLQLDDVVTDRFAPLGHGSYRVCLRTADGDEAWADYEYDMDVRVTRFDWAEGFLEVKWGLGFSDSYRKSWQKRQHMDGSSGGSSNPAIDRGGTYTASVLKGIDEGAVEALIEMCEYPGTVYCRRADGHAFQCNVNVDTSDTLRGMVMAPSFSVDRVSLTDEFAISSEDIEA